MGKTTRPFRYDLNQIPYDYRVEVINRIKGLDLIDRVPGELWTDVCDIVQETGITQAWKPRSQHAGEKRGVAGLLLGAQGLIPGSGRPPRGHGNPLQCSCLQNSTQRISLITSLSQ